ncbi:unnamed protein product [Symbiodinium microadriaticum]|nr:unnamed protein product [Symbiodinium microadriaticum]
MSGIVPEHTVLEGKQQPHFVVRTYPRGVLLWPLKTSPHSGHLTFDREIGALTWGFLFCLDNVMVRNLKVLAPVQAARPTNHWDPEACRALAEFVGGGIVAVTHDPLLTYRLIHCNWNGSELFLCRDGFLWKQRNFGLHGLKAFQVDGLRLPTPAWERGQGSVKAADLYSSQVSGQSSFSVCDDEDMPNFWEVYRALGQCYEAEIARREAIQAGRERGTWEKSHEPSDAEFGFKKRGDRLARRCSLFEVGRRLCEERPDKAEGGRSQKKDAFP